MANWKDSATKFIKSKKEEEEKTTAKNVTTTKPTSDKPSTTTTKPTSDKPSTTTTKPTSDKNSKNNKPEWKKTAEKFIETKKVENAKNEADEAKLVAEIIDNSKKRREAQKNGASNSDLSYYDTISDEYIKKYKKLFPESYEKNKDLIDLEIKKGDNDYATGIEHTRALIRNIEAYGERSKYDNPTAKVNAEKARKAAWTEIEHMKKYTPKYFEENGASLVAMYASTLSKDELEKEAERLSDFIYSSKFTPEMQAEYNAILNGVESDKSVSGFVDNFLSGYNNTNQEILPNDSKKEADSKRKVNLEIVRSDALSEKAKADYLISREWELARYRDKYGRDWYDGKGELPDKKTISKIVKDVIKDNYEDLADLDVYNYGENTPTIAPDYTDDELYKKAEKGECNINDLQKAVGQISPTAKLTDTDLVRLGIMYEAGDNSWGAYYNEILKPRFNLELEENIQKWYNDIAENGNLLGKVGAGVGGFIVSNALSLPSAGESIGSAIVSNINKSELPTYKTNFGYGQLSSIKSGADKGRAEIDTAQNADVLEFLGMDRESAEAWGEGVYGLTNSIAENLLRAPMGGFGGAIMMFAQSFASEYKGGVDSYSDPTKNAIMSTVTATAEGLTEKIELGALNKALDMTRFEPNVFKRMAKAALLSGGNEILGELSNDAVRYISDYALNGEESELFTQARQLVSDGKSDSMESAMTEILIKNGLNTAVVSFLSGAALGGVGGLFNYADISEADVRRDGEELLASGVDINELVRLGKESASKETRLLADKVEKNIYKGNVPDGFDVQLLFSGVLNDSADGNIDVGKTDDVNVKVPFHSESNDEIKDIENVIDETVTTAGEAVKLANAKPVENDVITVKTSDGNTVSAKGEYLAKLGGDKIYTVKGSDIGLDNGFYAVDSRTGDTIASGETKSVLYNAVKEIKKNYTDVAITNDASVAEDVNEVVGESVEVVPAEVDETAKKSGDGGKKTTVTLISKDGLKTYEGVSVAEDTGYELTAVERNGGITIVEKRSGMEFAHGATVEEAVANVRNKIAENGKDAVDAAIEKAIERRKASVNTSAGSTYPIEGDRLSVGRAVADADYTNTLLEMAKTSKNEKTRKAAALYSSYDFKNDNERYRALGDIAKMLGVSEADLVKSRAKSLFAKIRASISSETDVVDKTNAKIYEERQAAVSRGDTATVKALDYLTNLLNSEGSIISVSEMFAPNQYSAENPNVAVQVYGKRTETAFKNIGLDISVSVYYDSSENAARGEWIKHPNGHSEIKLNGAKLQGEQSAFWVVSHELIHEAESKSPGITQRMLDAFTKMGMYDGSQYEAYKARYNAVCEAEFNKELDRGNVTQDDHDEFVRNYVNEEIVADLMSETMSSSELVEVFAGKLGKDDANVIVSFLKKLLNGVKKVFNSKDEFPNKFSDIIGMFEGAVKGTDTKSSDTEVTKKSFSSIGAAFYGNEKMTANEMTRMLNDGSWKESEGYKKYLDDCVNVYKQAYGKATKSDIAQIEKEIEGIMRVAVAAKKAGYDILDNGAKRSTKDSKNRLLFSSLEPNSDYITSSDISAICDKRKTFTEIYDEIVRIEEANNVAPDERFFSKVDNYFILHKIMAEKGLVVPCEECYVESMRKNLAPMANAFITLVKETNAENKKNAQLYNQSGKNKGKLKENNAKIREKVIEICAKSNGTQEQIDKIKSLSADELAKFIDDVGSAENLGVSLDELTLPMLTTAEGLAKLKLRSPLLYEAFNSFYGQSKPKMPKEATPFRPGELIALFTDKNNNINQSLIKKVKSTGGFRLQSYSDFQIGNFVDVLQTIFEASMLGLNGHAYTKVPAFLDATEGTNLKRNLFIFMYEDGGKWMLDKKNSFPMELDDIYALVAEDESGNTSIIAVSQNAKMSAWIMANDLVGYGIPFHKSGLKMDIVRLRDVKTPDGRTIKGYSNQIDHTKQQSEVYKYDKDGKKKNSKVSKPIDIYSFWDFENKEGLSKNELIEKNLKAYIDECEKAGYRPKFRDYVMNNDKVLNDVLAYSKELGFVSEDATIDDISFKHGEYTIPYGYYKFLGDFGMFTPEGEASPIKPLTLAEYDFDKAVGFFDDAKALREKELLQQFENGKVREEYRQLLKEGKMTYEELQAVLEGKKNEVVQEVVERKFALSAVTDISSESKYAPAFYSHMERTISDMKQNKIGADSVIPYLKGKGVKNEEIKWSGIETFLEGKKSVSKAELQEFIAGSQLRIEARTLTNDNARWEEYTLDGGDNYREITFKIPNSTYTNDAMKAHWGDAAQGILAHARVQDFDVDGKKMLFIEEIQSDWHNAGHKLGYSSESRVPDKRIAELTALRERLGSGDLDYDEYQELYNEYKELEGELHLEGIDVHNKMNGVPYAPFRDNYHEFVLKCLIRIAAEQGYDSIGWTTADIQSKRWSDEFAEGYRIEYDQDIPQFLSKYGKKWGAEVGKTTIDGVKQGEVVDVYRISREEGYQGEDTDYYTLDEAVEALVYETNENFGTDFSYENARTLERDDDSVEVFDEETGDEIGTVYLEVVESSNGYAGAEIWAMNIPDSMKESVLYEGQPRYSLDDTGVYSLEDAWAEMTKKYGAIPKGETVYRDADASKNTTSRAFKPGAFAQKSADSESTVDDVSEKTEPTVEDLYGEETLDDSYFYAEGDKRFVKDDEYPEMWETTKNNYNQNQKNVKVRSPQEIVSMIQKLYIPVYIGHQRMSQDQSAAYEEFREVLVTKSANNLPAIFHDLGHHLDKLYDMTKLEGFSEVAKEYSKGLEESYSAEEIPHEAAAEFVRHFLMNNDEMLKKFPTFTRAFSKAVGGKMRGITKIANAANAYMSASEMQRLNVATVSREESEKMHKKYDGVMNAGSDLESKILTFLVDVRYPIDKVFRKAGIKFKDNDSPYRAALETLNSTAISSKMISGEGFYQHGATSASGKGLVRSLTSNGIKTQADIDALNDYLTAKHAVEWIQKGKRVFADDKMNTVEAQKQLADKLEKERPYLANAAKAIYEYRDNVIKYGIEAGIFDKDTMDTMRKMYPAYVPFWRDHDYSKSVSLLKHAKGSGRAILSPIENLMVMTKMTVSQSLYNRMNLAFADAIDTNEKTTHIARNVTPSMKKMEFSSQETKEKLSNALKAVSGGNFDIENFETVFNETIGEKMEFYAKNPAANSKNHIITAMRDGIPYYYQVRNADVYNALTRRFDESHRDIITKIGDFEKKLFTDWSPTFLPKNAFRDIRQAYARSTTSNPFKYLYNYFSAFVEARFKSKGFKAYLAQGGGYGSMVESSEKSVKKLVKKDKFRADIERRKELKKAFADQIREARKSGDNSKVQELKKQQKQELPPAHMILRGAKFAGDVLNFSELQQAIEQTPRYAEFKISRKTGQSVETAIYKSKNVTTMFGRKGTVTPTLNKWVIFSNAMLQSTYEGYRILAGYENDITPHARTKHIITQTTLGILATAFTYFMCCKDDEDKEDYEKLSAYMKYSHYVFPIGDGKFVRLPKANQNAIIDTLLTHAMLEKLGMVKPEERIALVEYLLGEFNPGFLIENIDGMTAESFLERTALAATANIPVIGTATELLTNKDFLYNPIVPEYMSDWLPEEQYYESTSEIAKKIGAVLKVSPLKVDSVIEGLGVAGDLEDVISGMFVDGVDSKDVNKYIDKAIDGLLEGAAQPFTTDNTYSNDLFNLIYDKRDEAQTKFDRDPSGENKLELQYYSSLASYISKRKSAIRDLPEDEQRTATRELLDEVYLKYYSYGPTKEDAATAEMYDKIEDENLKDKLFKDNVPKTYVTKSYDIGPFKSIKVTEELSQEDYTKVCEDIEVAEEILKMYFFEGGTKDKADSNLSKILSEYPDEMIKDMTDEEKVSAYLAALNDVTDLYIDGYRDKYIPEDDGLVKAYKENIELGNFPDKKAAELCLSIYERTKDNRVLKAYEQAANLERTVKGKKYEHKMTAPQKEEIQNEMTKSEAYVAMIVFGTDSEYNDYISRLKSSGEYDSDWAKDVRGVVGRKSRGKNDTDNVEVYYDMTYKIRSVIRDRHKDKYLPAKAK